MKGVSKPDTNQQVYVKDDDIRLKSLFLPILSTLAIAARNINTTEFIYVRLLLFSFTWVLTTKIKTKTVNLKSFLKPINTSILIATFCNASLICAYMQYQPLSQPLPILAIIALIFSYTILLPSVYTYFSTYLQEKYPNHLGNDICMAIFTIFTFKLPFISYGHIVNRAASTSEAKINITYTNILTLILVYALRSLPYGIIYVIIASLCFIYYLADLKGKNSHQWNNHLTLSSSLCIVVVYSVLRLTFSYGS